MSSTIRESITLDPISSERIDTTGAIHRYNFGWVKTQKIVADGFGDGTDDGSGNATVVDQCTTGLSGVGKAFKETTTQEILPPKLETPDVDPDTTMSDGIKMGTFFKFGIKMRTLVRTRAIGKPEVIVMGQQGYSIYESKNYADAIGSNSSKTFKDTIEAAEGGITITVANGVKTTTKIKG